jgi:hypothetical protein
MDRAARPWSLAIGRWDDCLPHPLDHAVDHRLALLGEAHPIAVHDDDPELLEFADSLWISLVSDTVLPDDFRDAAAALELVIGAKAKTARPLSLIRRVVGMGSSQDELGACAERRRSLLECGNDAAGGSFHALSNVCPSLYWTEAGH